MPTWNPFRDRKEVHTGLYPPDENVRPLSQNGTRPAFEKVDTTGSKSSSAMSITSKKSQDPVEYKMSGMWQLRIQVMWPRLNLLYSSLTLPGSRK
jgi:hypothetical protein